MYTLPPVSGGIATYAVRGIYRYTAPGGTVSPALCPSGSLNEADDIVFSVLPNVYA